MKTSRPQFIAITGLVILIASVVFLKGPVKKIGMSVSLLFLIAGMAGKIMNNK